MEISAHYKIRDTEPFYRYNRTFFVTTKKKYPSAYPETTFFAIETAGQGIELIGTFSNFLSCEWTNWPTSPQNF